MEELRVLVTTDTHLGFAERDHIRGEDSFRAFEEVFQHARETRADCVLICGDLFHDVNPSKYTIYRTMEILQRNILGKKPIEVECTDNGNFVDIQKRTRNTNYYSENINIEVPVFAINGNHDEPSGHKGITALDIFAEAGLINYFGGLDGKITNKVLRPIVLRKKNAILNLYGMGGLRDETMANLLSQERIVLEAAFKGVRLLVLHQTRCGAGVNSYVPEELLSKEVDLVIWGHMHKSEPVPVKNYKMGFHTIQPGSTVQTSLCKAESGDKHCVLLKVTEDGWASTPVLMQTPRSLVFRTILATESTIEKKIKTEMRALLEEHTGERRPLVRLRVEVDNTVTSTVIPKRAMEEFKDKVANPRDVLRIIHKKKQPVFSRKEEMKGAHKNAQFVVDMEEVKILSKPIFMQSIMECIEKENKFIISKRYDEIVQEVVQVLKSHRWTDIEKEIPPAVQEIEKRLCYIYTSAQIDKNRHAEIKEPEESRAVEEQEITQNLYASIQTENIEERQAETKCYIGKKEESNEYAEKAPEESNIPSANHTENPNPAKRPKTNYSFSSFWE